ncbi:MAG: SUF system Fe-S cluster assembly regulator [Deltaproteobacteria bacterium]|nr:SUF system Fe-S cluster assembly regulator [bacterium]MCB9476645.1 SUF system Fe-S cluster assembly regulator [Deltaproteobacteria bacterium]MCB9479592.1 SUF system Fe-S cluster assembly regulator [Deltaproteobacteria bacterium]MCB9488828.1 SUF system Fe-S cluster assembly regulator [Deltaproteobacteria bacterium]
MLRINKLTDYGIVLLTRLVNATDDETSSVRELADQTRLTQPMTSKILKILTREGILESQRGVKGGYRLARDSREISMAQVITALEGPIGITECTSHTDDGEEECQFITLCPVHGNWQKINHVVQQALASISLYEMVSPAAGLLDGALDAATKPAPPTHVAVNFRPGIGGGRTDEAQGAFSEDNRPSAETAADNEIHEANLS